MTWTSVEGAQRACQKGVRASGPKGLKPTYYFILFYFLRGMKKLSSFWMT